MSIKIINITVPSDAIIPEILSTFSPEENYMMLKIGSESLSEGRKQVENLTSDEIFKKVRNDFEKEIQNLNNEISTERKTSLLMNEKITRMYETQLDQLNKKFENALSQIEIYKQGNSSSLNEELNKVKQKYDLLLEEKDRQNQLNREVFDKAEKLINKTSNKSSISIGDDGEQIFETLADTFKDFAGYKIENKAKQGHKGDFHLFFKDFNVLVDSKNYSGSVQKKEIIKIESDLTINDNMNFAWMVSLNSNICDYNRFPIMTKWITTDVGVKCILFINNLLEHKDPRNILRQAWSMCEDFYKLTKSVDKEDGELEEYREQNLLYKKHIEKLQERAAELRRSVNTSFNILKHIDNDILEMLSLMSDKIVNEKFTLSNKIKEWWDDNIEYINDDSKLISTEIWNKFKKDNKEYVGENKITIESFKSDI
jgi:DNA repair exonuclease SbcCD ATPase subunit